MTWAVLDSYGFEAVEVIKETVKTVTYRHPRWGQTRTDKHKVFPFRGDEDAARSVAARITSANAEYWRRRQSASDWYDARKAEIFAKAIEAASAGETTEIGSTEGESAVPEGNLPK